MAEHLTHVDTTPVGGDVTLTVDTVVTLLLGEVVALGHGVRRGVSVGGSELVVGIAGSVVGLNDGRGAEATHARSTSRLVHLRCGGECGVLW